MRLRAKWIIWDNLTSASNWCDCLRVVHGRREWRPLTWLGDVLWWLAELFEDEVPDV